MTIKTRKSTAPENKETKTLSRARKPDAAKVAEAKSQAVEAAPESVTPAAPGEGAAERPITGRGVFAVRTLGNAVSVEAAFLAEDGNVLRLPAVFPNLEYAKSQIEELWQLVHRHFGEIEQQGANPAQAVPQAEPKND